MDPYQQPYGPPGYGVPPANNYYGTGYPAYGGGAPAAPGSAYQGGAPGYPAPSMPQDPSYAPYPSGNYYGAPLPYGTSPYQPYPQAGYPAAPYNPYAPAPTGYGQPPNAYQGQYNQAGYPVTTTAGDTSSYPAATMSYGFPSAPPDPSASGSAPPDPSGGFSMPPTTAYDPFGTPSGGYNSASQFSTTVTDSNGSQKPPRPPPPSDPYSSGGYGGSQFPTAGSLKPDRPPPPQFPSANDSAREREASSPQPPPADSSWRGSSPANLPTPKPRDRSTSPSGAMSDKPAGSDRSPEAKRHVLTTADEWNEIANAIEEGKKDEDSDRMDPSQLSGIASDDPRARAEYKRKLNALAGLMTDVNLDETGK